MTSNISRRIKGVLVSAGHDDKERSSTSHVPSFEERETARRAHEDLGRTGTLKCRPTSGDYFISTPDGDEALVAYNGSVHREGERLRLYRLALENCSFRVTEEDDPGREGRRVLRVAR